MLINLLSKGYSDGDGLLFRGKLLYIRPIMRMYYQMGGV